MDLIQSNAITTLHRLASVEDVVQFVRLCVDKSLVIDFILKEELDAFITFVQDILIHLVDVDLHELILPEDVFG